MCNCYEHPCEICGEAIPMHLADFNTHPQEIIIVHVPKCLLKLRTITSPNKRRNWRSKPYTDWEWREEETDKWKTIRVFHLTANARIYSEGNHPNAERIKLRGK